MDEEEINTDELENDLSIEEHKKIDEEIRNLHEERVKANNVPRINGETIPISTMKGFGNKIKKAIPREPKPQTTPKKEETKVENPEDIPIQVVKELPSQQLRMLEGENGHSTLLLTSEEALGELISGMRELLKRVKPN